MRTRFSLRLSPFTSFPFSQARKHNWPEYSLWDLGPICIVGQLICLGPRSHLRRRSAYLPGTMVPPPSSVRLSAWDHGPTSVVGQVICWDHGPTSVAGQVICLGPWSHLRRRSGYLPGGPWSHLRRRSGYLPGGPRSHLHRRHIISLGQRFNQCLSRKGIGLSPSTR